MVNVAVFGLGYVGCVSAACLAKVGHRVIGVDVNPAKVDMINAGTSPIIEKDMDGLVREGVTSGNLRATTSAQQAVSQSDVSIICVGTPSQEGGGPDLQFIKHVSREIGGALANTLSYHVVAMRSTVPPGAIKEVVIPLLEETSGKKIEIDFGVCSNPEFLREGSAVFDFANPPFTLIGATDAQAGDQLAQLYAHLAAPVIRTDIKTAEMAKYVSNAYHALKITFANEIGTFCKSMGIDSHAVMNVFAMDTKLNISAAYLKPGYAFGGSCLPKDLRTLLHRARHQDLDLPLLQSIVRSNEQQIQRGVELLLKTGKKRVGILGLSFKPGTDDLRESPMVVLIETLLGKGYDIRIYDENVSLAKLVGANRAYIEHAIPHISSLLCSSIDQVLNHAEVLVIGHRSSAFAEVARQVNDKPVIDLVRVVDDLDGLGQDYQGICW